jgi:heat shock protein HslJ
VSKTGNITASGLEGVNWHLDSYLSREGETACVLPDTQVTALFESSRVSGNAGCNSYSTSYEVNDSTIEIFPAAFTRMYCSIPEGVMEQESEYPNNTRAVIYEAAGG